MIKLFNTLIHKQQGDFGISAIIILILSVLAAASVTYFVMDAFINVGQDDSHIEEGEQEVRNYFGFGCWWSSEYYGCQSQFLDSGNVFEAQQTMTLTMLDCLAGRDVPGNIVFRVEVWTWDDVAEEHDELVGYSNLLHQADMIYWPYGSGELPQCTFTFADQAVVLLEDVQYCFRRVVYSGTTGSVWCSQRTAAHPCSTEIHIGAYASGNYYADNIFEYWIQGYTIQTPTVTTIGSEIRGDGSVWLSGWCDVVANMNVGFLVSETEATVQSGQGIKYDCGETGLSEPRHHFEQRVISILSDVTYHYRAYAELNGIYYYGAVKSFMRLSSGILPSITTEIHTNTLDLVEFNTSFIDVPGNSTWQVRIYYAKTMCILLDGTHNISVAVDVTADGSWFTEVSPTLFDPGNAYYFRACADEALGSRVCSTTQTFVTYDPSQPAVLNWLASTFNLDFEWLWWAIAILGLLAIWFVAGYTKWWWLGLIGTGVLMVILITFGFVNPWVVVVLTIVVGWIIFKLIFKHSGGTSS